jgi:MFS transporter, ACS family, solute carrier family 17 (sodium-dependent inorganic phosphate cotransporter), other
MSAEPDATRARWGRRHVVIALCFVGLVLAYTDRVNIAVASVAMREQFGWSQSIKGLVLSAFFVGYLLFMVASGVLAARFGGRRVLAVAVVWWSMFTLLTPLAAATSLTMLILARVALGLGEAAVLPASYELFGRWVPAAERSRAVSWFLSGTALGQVVGLTGSGWLTAGLGWPSSFYVFGSLGFVWVAVWLASVKQDPAEDARLSNAERKLLAANRSGDEGTAPAAAAARTPWRILLGSPALWAIVAGVFCVNWTLYLLLAWLPSYFRDVYHLSLANSGLYAAGPWFASFLGMHVAGLSSDAAIARGVRIITVRRAMTTIGLLGPGSCLLALQYVDQVPLALTLICTAGGLGGAAAAGCFAGPLDIAPRHAGAVIGFVNTIGTIPGVAGVAMTGWLLDVTHGYQATFLITAVLGMLGTLFYWRFARSEPIVN